MLLKKPVMAGWPVSVTLLTVTPGPSSFCTNACALLEDVMFNWAFDCRYKKMQVMQSRNILHISFTWAQVNIYLLNFETGHKKVSV
jgi:hypothetical protein